MLIVVEGRVVVVVVVVVVVAVVVVIVVVVVVVVVEEFIAGFCHGRGMQQGWLSCYAEPFSISFHT